MATVVTNAGLAIITNRMIGSGTEPKWVAMGTGAGTAAVSDTTLFTEVESRTDGTSSRTTTTATNDTYRVVGTITATASRSVTNAGLFDASSGGNLLMKGDFSTINLSTSDSIEFTCRVVFANA